MIALALLLLVIILVVLIFFKNSTSLRLQQLEKEIKLLRKELSPQATTPVAATVIAEEKPIPPVVQPEEKEEWTSGFKVVTGPVVTFKKEDWLPKEAPAPEPAPATVFNQPAPLHGEPSMASSTITTPPVAPRPPKPGFFERNPDLERFIGENLVSKIGIAILVLAIAYFVKFAIDNNWIGPIGRVGVGVVCGGILIGVAHRLRKGYHAFSSVLAGGGLAVLYFTITLAYQQFHLFSQTTAFIILLVVTSFAVLLALLYNRQELAVIALVGGFASPFLVSNGSGNYVTLFVYLILLNTGLLIIAYNKTWRVLNVIAFAFTVILFGLWLASLPYTTTTQVYANGLLFSAIFYLLFFVINIANNIKERKQFLPFDFSILLLNMGLFFSAGLYCLHQMNATAYNGLFSAVMAVFNLAATYFLFKKNRLDKNILCLLIGITLTFVSLTAPLQLHGHFITLFWASEAALLCWLFTKSNISIIQYASVIVYAAMLISLLMDWVNVYMPVYDIAPNSLSLLTVIANRGFITSIYTAAASYLIFFILYKNNIGKYAGFIQANAFRFIAIILLFLGGLIETSYQFSHRFPLADITVLYVQLYILAFVLLLLFITNRFTRFAWSNKFKIVLLVACIILYFIQLPGTIAAQQALSLKENSSNSYLFAGHWISAVLMTVLIYWLIDLLKLNKHRDIAAWILCGIAVAYLSAETYLLMNNLFTNAISADRDRVFVKVVLPVLWGLCSFVFMWLGMKNQYKNLRIISLTLFSVTLLKLFIYDISNIPIAGKIAAFFCLGILLLIISFMYQRLKKIIIEDEKKHSA